MEYNTFAQNLKNIQQYSEEIHDNWELLGNEDEEGLYLKKDTIIVPKHSEEEQILKCEYHITYNISYGVPMLCFNMWDTNGKLLTMEDAWKIFDKTYLQDNMFSVLTQKDHPVLQTPFLTLHPCKTAEILELFLEKSSNPIVSWLSTIAPAIHLELNPDYEILTRM